MKKTKQPRRKATKKRKAKPTVNGLSLIQAEHDKAKKKYPNNFNSNHEGYSVLKEEVDELWDEVKRKNPSKAQLREEAVQIGAMALRIINELT